MRTSRSRPDPIDQAAAVEPIVALLEHHPSVATLTSEPAERSVTLSFAVRGDVDRDAERELRETLGDHVHALLELSRETPDLFVVAVDSDPELSFVRVTRDARTLSREELGLVGAVLAARFETRLVDGVPGPADADAGARDETIDRALDALRDPSSSRGLVGVREEAYVTVYVVKNRKKRKAGARR